MKFYPSISIISALLVSSFSTLVQAQQDTVESESAVNSSAEASPATNTSLQPAAGVATLRTTVTGNQEQPKVLYIVPWQAAEDERILYEPLNSQTNRVFSHIERSEHLRELEFISELGGSLGK